jgi:hypothetical protein
MRGGAQAQLIEAEDGHWYVVKPRNNPQHRRILVNEWVGAAFLRFLQILTPDPTIIETPPEFLQEYPDCCLQLQGRQIAWEPGWQYGSRYPGDPSRLAIFDFLPDSLLPKVGNRADFIGVFVFDKWTANADGRQAVFYRATLRDLAESGHGRPGYVASMIDHGYLFDGPHWAFADSPLRGLYHRPVVYEAIRGWSDLEPWIERIRSFPEEVVDTMLRSLPPQWLADEDSLLDHLLESLMRRRKRVADLIEETITSDRVRAFPNWRATAR